MRKHSINDDTILFNTGRMYSYTEGQIIIARRCGPSILFVDTSRMISGIIFDCPLEVGNILDAYDRNEYEHSLPMEKRRALEELALVHKYKII